MTERIHLVCLSCGGKGFLADDGKPVSLEPEDTGFWCADCGAEHDIVPDGYVLTAPHPSSTVTKGSD